MICDIYRSPYFLCIILITLFTFSYSQCVLGEKADNATDCLKKSINGTFCCFLSPLDDDSLDKICYPYGVTEYLGTLQINYNKNTYEIDCGLGSTFMDSYWNLTVEDRYICGVEHPEKKEDCYKGSTDSNSCCFYEGHGLTSCYWLGVKYQATTSKNGWTFSCDSLNVLYGYFWYVFVMFIYF